MRPERPRQPPRRRRSNGGVLFIYPFFPGRRRHSRHDRGPPTKKQNAPEKFHTWGRVWGAARPPTHLTPLPSDPPRGPYSSMAFSEAGSYSSTSIPPLDVSWASVGASPGGEVLTRCLHVREGDLHPFASPRAAFFGQAFPYGTSTVRHALLNAQYAQSPSQCACCVYVLLAQTVAFCTNLLVQQWAFSKILHVGTLLVR